MKRRFDNLFPTPVGVIDIEDLELCQKISNEILGLMNDEDKVELETYSSWCTKDNLHTNPNFLELVNLIDKLATDFFEEILGVSRDDVMLSAMWSNVNQRGSQHQMHYHPNSFFSGVLYVDTPEGSNKIMFVDPRPSKNMVQADYKIDNEYASRAYQYLPETGLMLLFPGWLEHGTAKCQLEKGINRISLSFNYTLLKCSEHTMSFNHRGIE